MHLKLKDFESLIDCNCQNSWDKNLICTELCSPPYPSPVEISRHIADQRYTSASRGVSKKIS